MSKSKSKSVDDDSDLSFCYWSMKIAICSDSHDQVENIQKFCDDVVTREVDFLIHLGDFISTGQTVMKFLGLNISCYFVRGNNDGEKIVITKKIMRADHADCANTVFAELELGDKRFFLSHYDLLGHPVACSGQYDVVCYGHNHLRHKERIGQTLLLNPGAIQGNKESASYCVYDTEADTVDFIEL